MLLGKCVSFIGLSVGLFYGKTYKSFIWIVTNFFSIIISGNILGQRWHKNGL